MNYLWFCIIGGVVGGVVMSLRSTGGEQVIGFLVGFLVGFLALRLLKPVVKAINSVAD